MATYNTLGFIDPTYNKKNNVFSGNGGLQTPTLGGVIGTPYQAPPIKAPSGFDASGLFAGTAPMKGMPEYNKPIVPTNTNTGNIATWGAGNQPQVQAPQKSVVGVKTSPDGLNTITTYSDGTTSFAGPQSSYGAPTTQTPPQPESLASILSGDKGGVYQGQDGNFYYSDGSIAPGPMGQVAIPTDAENYANTLKQYQSDIDAINNMYNDTLNQSRVTNAPEYAAREAQNRLQQIQGGIASSPMGSAQTTGVQSANRQEQAIAEQIINIQRQNAINALKGEIRQMSTKDLEAKRAAKKGTADDYVKFLNEAPERKSKNLSAGVKKALLLGLSIEQIDPKEIEALGGLEDFTAEYNSQKASAESEANKADLAQRKTEADIAQTEKETSLLGQMTHYQSASLGIEREKLASTKAEKEKEFKTYDSKTIPSEIKKEIISDLQSNSNAKRKDRKTLNDFISAYPEIDSTYLVKLFEEAN